MTTERFSTSCIWNLQNEAYTQFGISAWSQHGVPFYLTSNPHTAKQYAQVVLGYLRDLIAQDAATPIVDISQPLYLFDLGAGTGRFGYLFLKEFLAILPYTAAKGIRLKYVLTDIAPENIAFWQHHVLLKPYFEAGYLDCAYFRHDQTEPIHLIISDQTLSAQAVANPIILLANYFFDTIPQDFFRIEEGVLQEGRVGLRKKMANGQMESVVTTSPEQINRLNFQYDFHSIPHVDTYYADPVWNQILKEYLECEKNCSFLMPVGTFQALDFFRQLSGSRLLLVGGDQGVVEMTQIRDMPYPRISLHGTFSVAVNYHALAIYLRLHGGAGFLTTLSDPTFVTIGGILGGTKDKFLETQLAFKENLDRFEPQDYWYLAADLQEHASLNLSAILRLSKFGDWDPINFMVSFQKIREALPNATHKETMSLKKALDQVQINYFPISKEDAVFYTNLGVLAYEIQDYAKAIELFKKAVELAGGNAELYGNLSASYRAIGEAGIARDYFLKAQRLKAV